MDMVNPAPPAIGITFSPRPSPRQLIEYYLRPKIAGELHHSSAASFIIRDANVYSAAPYDLVAHHQAPTPAPGDHGAQEWYFFSPVGYASASRRTRRSRTVAGGKGTWHTEVGRKQVQGSAGGYMSTFSYKEKTSLSGTIMPGGRRWRMDEYSIDGYDIVIARIYISSRGRRAMSLLQEMQSFLMSEDAGGAGYLVESQQAGLSHYHDNGSQAIMDIRCLTSPPPPMLSQGTGAQYPAGQHQHQFFLAGEHHVAAAAAAAAGQGAGDYYLAVQHHVAAAAGQVAGHPPGHADHANMVVLGHNQTVLGAGYAYAPAQPQHLTPDVVFQPQPHIASTSGGGLPNHLELDHQFALDDDLLWNYHNTYFG